MSFGLWELPDLSENLSQQSESFGNDLRQVFYDASETIYTPTIGSESVYLLIEGEVQLYRVGSDGRRFTVATLRPGAAFGQASLLGSLESETYAEATEKAVVWSIAERSAREVFSRSPNLRLGLLTGLSQRLADAQERLESMAYKKVPARLAVLLLQMMDVEEGTVTGITHQNMADMLGTYRETVSQAFRELRDKGLVSPGRKKIKILDPEGLRKIAEKIG